MNKFDAINQIKDLINEAYSDVNLISINFEYKHLNNEEMLGDYEVDIAYFTSANSVKIFDTIRFNEDFTEILPD